MSRLNRVARLACLVAGVAVVAPCALANSTVSLKVTPGTIGPGDTFVVEVKGCPGEFGIVFGSFDLGPTPFPGVGSLDVMNPFFSLILPAFTEDPFLLPCDPFCLDLTSPLAFHFQAVTMTPNGFGGAKVNAKSEVGTIVYDGSLFIDCNHNGEPDVCDVLKGGEPDCNGNLIPDSCEIDSGAEQDADHNGIPDSCQDCIAYPAPAKIGDPGRYKLDDNGGNAAPPTYGLRLDGVCNDYPTIYTFTFEAPGTEMFLDYDGKGCARIHGIAYGGVDVGNDWDAVKQGFVEIDVAVCDIVVENGQLRTYSEAAVDGNITLPFLSKTVHLTGKGKDGDGLVWSFDGHGGEGWLKYDWGKPGCCQDFIFGGTAIATECVFAALDNGSFEAGAKISGTETFSAGQIVKEAWHVVDGTVDLKQRSQSVGSALPADAGDQLIDLHGSGPGSIQQVLHGLTPGKTYQVKFLYAIHPDSSEAVGRVLVGGGSLLDHQWTATNKGNSFWKTKTKSFTASAAMETLTFVGVSATQAYGGMHIDMVEVLPTN